MDGDEATEAARARVAALLEALPRLDLQVVIVARPDKTRLTARDRASEAAILAGRASLLYESTAAARGAVIQMFARAGFSGTWALTRMSVSVASADDRVAAAAAFEEAAMAAVVEDLVDEKTLSILRSTSDEFTRLKGLPSPGSLGLIALPATGVVGPWPTVITVVISLVILVGAFSYGGPSAGIVVLFAVAMIVALIRRRA